MHRFLPTLAYMLQLVPSRRGGDNQAPPSRVKQGVDLTYIQLSHVSGARSRYACSTCAIIAPHNVFQIHKGKGEVPRGLRSRYLI